jgi:CDP-4-dehydro-6-deoxyglucose reductase, E1
MQNLSIQVATLGIDTSSNLSDNYIMKEILELVEKYINDKNAKKTWTPGKDWVQYAGPYFGVEEYTESIKTLLDGWLVLGQNGIRFEQKFPKLMQKQFGVLTNSGSSSNLIMMSALTSKRLTNFPKGTKVITPIAGFPTTINPIFQVGFEPVFVDIELDTLNLNLDQVEERAKEGCKIITFAHVLGNPPNMDRLMEIIDEYGLILLEDCCDALGSTYRDRALGSYGDFASCSFYPAHHITMGEGGFVACNTKMQEMVARSFREWGRGCYCVGKKAGLLKNGTCKTRFSNWLPALPDEIFDHKYVYDEIGYNLKPTDLQAAMGLVQLDRLPEIVEKRKYNHKRLCDIFSKYEDYFVIPKKTEHSDPAWFAFALTIKDNAPFVRKDIVDHLENAMIQTRPYFAGNIMLQPAYEGLMDQAQVLRDYPNARKVTTDTFFLGTSPVITEEQLDYIEQVVDNFCGHSI